MSRVDFRSFVFDEDSEGFETGFGSYSIKYLSNIGISEGTDDFHIISHAHDAWLHHRDEKSA